MISRRHILALALLPGALPPALATRTHVDLLDPGARQEPDEHYIVALAEGRGWDLPLDGVLVFSADGTLLLEHALQQPTVSGQSAYPAAWPLLPSVALSEKDGGVTLTVGDRAGTLHAFDLPPHR